MKLAVIRVRGLVHVRHDMKQTLDLMGLKKKNNCTIIEDTAVAKGMIKKVQHFITWGPINEEALTALNKRKGKKVFALTPPRKGFGRKGIKMPFKLGGALGDRGEKINDLLMRMV